MRLVGIRDSRRQSCVCQCSYEHSKNFPFLAARLAFFGSPSPVRPLLQTILRCSTFQGKFCQFADIGTKGDLIPVGEVLEAPGAYARIRLGQQKRRTHDTGKCNALKIRVSYTALFIC